MPYFFTGHQVFALVVGLVMHIIGYCSESWGVAKNLDPERRLGVWENCYCDRNTPDESTVIEISITYQCENLTSKAFFCKF